MQAFRAEGPVRHLDRRVTPLHAHAGSYWMRLAASSGYIFSVLPVRARIQFKVLLRTYKALNNLAPEYITELLTIYSPSRTSRSDNLPIRLTAPRTGTTRYSRCFYAIAPTLWNELPINLKRSTSVPMFKIALKTHLFRNFIHKF